MCRIAGIIDKHSETIENDIIAMRDAMQHGGPDSNGIYIDRVAGLAFGHRRLSIIDLSEGGNQPMMNDSENIVLIYNGEIYNYRQLKKELEATGAVFKTNSDTEVIIKGYEHWGTSCFAKLRGMFAVALYDKKKQQLLLVRDQTGIKPLYYYCDNDTLYFASEIRAFKKLKKDWEANRNWKVYFLTYGYLPEPITTLKGIKPVEKGSYVVVDMHSLKHKTCYYYEDSYSDRITNIEDAKEIVRATLTSAVERHLISDAPIGLFLSGGIDSSLLTLIAKSFKKEDLYTLSIIFDDEQFSEKKYQDIIVDKCNSIHQSFVLDKEMFIDAVPDIMMAMDQPSSDAINTYFISKFAKQTGLKAVLSGLGADELMGGYSSFRLSQVVDNSKLVPGFLFQAAELFPVYKYKKISFLERKDPVGEYLFNRGYFSPLETAKMLDMDISEVGNILDNIKVPASVERLKDGNRISFLESNLYMQSQLLKDTDIMSMWHSVEVRVPFLDTDFISAIHHINTGVKFNDRQNKYLLIESFKDILPREIWDRKKQGFVFPFRKWIKNSGDKTFHCANEAVNEKFNSGKMDWNRYWTYLVSDTFNN
jgi:asparagine synthase (glutamine-hydrolysing)